MKRYKMIFFTMFTFTMFMLGFAPSAFAISVKDVSISAYEGSPLPVYENESYYIQIKLNQNYVEVIKDGVTTTYETGRNMPADLKIYFTLNGSYDVKQYSNSGEPFANYRTTFTIFDAAVSPPPDGGTTTAIDYSGALFSIDSKISSAVSRLDSVISGVSGVNGRLDGLSGMIDSHFNNALAKMDTTNSILGMIKNELQTDFPVPYEYEEDYTDDLEANKPVQNQQSYADNTEYFSAPAETVVTSTMPQATEPEQWEGVEAPEQMQAEQSLSSDSELFKDLENVKDMELSVDQFVKSEELTKDSYSADSEMTKDSYSADSEMTKDNFSADGEMTKDSFSNTENYSKENEMQQTEVYTAIPNNPNLRWKSVNGQFQ